MAGSLESWWKATNGILPLATVGPAPCAAALAAPLDVALGPTLPRTRHACGPSVSCSGRRCLWTTGLRTGDEGRNCHDCAHRPVPLSTPDGQVPLSRLVGAPLLRGHGEDGATTAAFGAPLRGHVPEASTDSPSGRAIRDAIPRGYSKNSIFLRTAPRDHQLPTTNHHQPPTTTNANRQPPTTSGNEPPTANHCQPPPTIDHQPPTAANQHPPPQTVTGQLFTIYCHQPPTANRHQAWLNI